MRSDDITSPVLLTSLSEGRIACLDNFLLISDVGLYCNLRQYTLPLFYDRVAQCLVSLGCGFESHSGLI